MNVLVPITNESGSYYEHFFRNRNDFVRIINDFVPIMLLFRSYYDSNRPTCTRLLTPTFKHYPDTWIAFGSRRSGRVQQRVINVRQHDTSCHSSTDQAFKFNLKLALRRRLGGVRRRLVVAQALAVQVLRTDRQSTSCHIPS